jgi:hypothetical protein
MIAERLVPKKELGGSVSKFNIYSDSLYSHSYSKLGNDPLKVFPIRDDNSLM